MGFLGKIFGFGDKADNVMGSAPNPHAGLAKATARTMGGGGKKKPAAKKPAAKKPAAKKRAAKK